MADTVDSPEVHSDKPHNTSDVTSVVRPGVYVEGDGNNANSDSSRSTRQVAPPEASGRALEVAVCGGAVDGKGRSKDGDGVRLLERASTLILTSAPTLSRGRSVLIKEEVEVLAHKQVNQQTDPCILNEDLFVVV